MENQNTHFIFSNFLNKIVSLMRYVVNIVEHDWPQMAIWHMGITCWILKATNTLSEYVILIIDFPLQQ